MLGYDRNGTGNKSEWVADKKKRKREGNRRNTPGNKLLYTRAA